MKMWTLSSAELVRARGLRAVTTIEARQTRQTDPDQLAYAVANQLTLLTHNRVYFEMLAREYVAQDKTHCGIILAGRSSPYENARRVLALARQTTATQIHNQDRYI